MNTATLKIGEKFQATASFHGKTISMREWTVDKENKVTFRVRSKVADHGYSLYLSKTTGLITA